MKPIVICILLSFMLLTSRAEAEGGVNSYGLLVGSNLPGENQEVLRFAHQDAARMGDVLSEVGGFAPAHLTLLTDPDRRTLTDALDAVQQTIEDHHDRNEQSSFLFYYSGLEMTQTFLMGHKLFK